MFLTWSSVVAAVAILSLIGPSHSTVIPLTNQPVSHGQTSAHSQTLGVSGSSRANTPNQFPAHDPFGRAKIYPGMVPHYPSPDSGQKRQILQLTFQPQGGRLLQNSTQPLPTLKAVYSPTGSGDPSNQDTASILINPANIQWTAPDVPDSVSKEIIEALRAQLGNTPVPLGELNNKMLTFTTSLPSVVINRTMINNVQETVLEENMANKSTRTMLSSYKPVSTTYKVSSSSGYDGHPSKTYVSYDYTTPITSMSYNPAAVYDSSRSAAGPPYSANDYQKSYSEQQYSYQVPTESSYQTNYYQPPPPPPQPQSYTKPQLAYQPDSSHQQQAPPPPAYQKAPESSYSKPPQPQPYQPPKVDYQPPKSEPYQPPKESYAAPLPSQQQYQSPPPPPPPPQPSKTSDYQKPKAEPYQPPKEAAYPQQQQKKQQSYAPPKEENVKIIYKYVEVCNPKADSYQPTPPAPQKQPYKQSQPKQSQYPNQSKTSNPYVEVATNLASQYPSSPEPLNLDLASTTTEAAGSAQDSQAILASVYGEIHRRMAELEQLQRYVAQVQNEAQQAAYVPINIPPIYIPPMPTFSYSVPSYPEPPVPNYPEAQVPSTYYSPPVPAPNYPPPPPPKSYAPPPAPAKQPEYRKPPSYTEQKSPSYSAPKPPSYTAQPPPQQQSYGSQQPYNGQQMTVQYQKTVEKVSSNSTSAY